MTNQFVIETLIRLRDNEYVHHDDAFEAIKIACDAIEKQTPKKLKGLERDKDYHYLFGSCPMCETFMCRNDFSKYHAFCDVCGQALDWEL